MQSLNASFVCTLTAIRNHFNTVPLEDNAEQNSPAEKDSANLSSCHIFHEA
jgi:hypothetical protein